MRKLKRESKTDGVAEFPEFVKIKNEDYNIFYNPQITTVPDL